MNLYSATLEERLQAYREERELEQKNIERQTYLNRRLLYQYNDQFNTIVQTIDDFNKIKNEILNEHKYIPPTLKEATRDSDDYGAYYTPSVISNTQSYKSAVSDSILESLMTKMSNINLTNAVKRKNSYDPYEEIKRLKETIKEMEVDAVDYKRKNEYVDSNTNKKKKLNPKEKRRIKLNDNKPVKKQKLSIKQELKKLQDKLDQLDRQEKELLKIINPKVKNEMKKDRIKKEKS